MRGRSHRFARVAAADAIEASLRSRVHARGRSLAVPVRTSGTRADIDLDLNAVGIEHEQLPQIAARYLGRAVLDPVLLEACDELVVVVCRERDVIDAAAAMPLARGVF